MKVLFILSLTAVSLLVINSAESKFLGTLKAHSFSSHGVAKTKAFRILKTKCNVCHVKQNRKKVFTLDNMDFFAAKIHKQVFVKKRMPKGKEITLTNSDYTTLKNWLKTLYIK